MRQRISLHKSPNVRANAILYSLYMLAIHPQVQEKLHQEVQEVCGNRPPDFNDVPNLTYLMCIMYEVMRLFPVVGALPTRPEQDQILLGKHLIPKNTCVGIDLVSLHRNEKYWGDKCNEFNPSRFDNRTPNPADSQNWQTFMDGKLKIPTKGAFFAFGEGPRACLGISDS
jgi:cytochrome P450